MNFKEELKLKTDYVEGVLRKYLPGEDEDYKVIAEAFSYSLLAGGKRLRPVFMLEAFKVFGGEDTAIVEPFMAALEMIHTYSLVHDDLPAMDNDEYRRGKKTTHAVYGEAMGILTGDALLNHAFYITADAMAKESDKDRLIRMTKALKVLARKPSIDGMIGGQVMDIMSSGNIIKMYRYKTSALIECALMCGGYLAGAGDEEIKKLEKAGELIGLAFQIRDDILDITGTEEELGKPVGSDERNNKNTYVSRAGIENAQKKVKEDSDKAMEIIKGLKGDTEFLLALTESLLERKK